MPSQKRQVYVDIEQKTEAARAAAVILNGDATVVEEPEEPEMDCEEYWRRVAEILDSLGHLNALG